MLLTSLLPRMCLTPSSSRTVPVSMWSEVPWHSSPRQLSLLLRLGFEMSPKASCRKAQPHAAALTGTLTSSGKSKEGLITESTSGKG